MYRRVLQYLTLVAVAGCQIGDSTGPNAKVLPSSPALAIVTGGSQTAANASSGASSLTIPKPAGVVDGDLLVAQISFEKGNEVDFTRPGTVPPGWVLAQRNDFGSDIGQAIFYKEVPTASLETATSYTWLFRKSDNSPLQVRATGGITRYAGADLIHHLGPILTSSGASGDGTSLIAPGVIATENSVLIAFFSVKKRTTLSNPTVPAAMVSVYHRQHANGSGPTIRSSNETRASDGPTLQRSSTASAGDKWVAQLVVLRAPACEEPDPDCESEEVNLATGGNVEIAQGGVTIEPGSGVGTHTITVGLCPPLNDRVTDLPQFGSCIRVTADPPLPASGLLVPARVYACDLAPDLGDVVSEEQEHLITLHRLDGSILHALPHADDDCDGSSSEEFASAGANLRGFLADIAHFRWKSARSHLAGLLTPKPLYATMMLDEGGGGETPEFSDFQFLLPSTMEIVEETNNQTGTPGQPLNDDPTVLVTDLLGNPVSGARVTFTTADGSVSPTPVVTGADGTASTGWTIGNLGANAMTASGRGIAGDDPNNGPRAGDENCWRLEEEEGGDCQDPWQPLDEDFGDASDGLEVLVGTGTRTFNATGVAEPISAGLFDFGADGYSSKELSGPTAAPAGWQTQSFNALAAGFSFPTNAAFGSGTGTCPGLVFATPWAVGGEVPNDILVRRMFTLVSPTTLEIRVSADNDLSEIWLNGTKQLIKPVLHEGCADPGTSEDFVIVAPGIAGVNTLAIRARDRAGVSYLNVKVSAAAAGIPNPVLAFAGSEPGIPESGNTVYNLVVTNWRAFPAELFVPSPALPPCGLNTSASRTWVEIYNGSTNAYIYGFCAFGAPSDLQLPWFASPAATRPATVYVKLIDRLTSTTYTSNTIPIP